MKLYYNSLVKTKGTKLIKTYRLNSYRSMVYIKKNKNTVYMYLNTYGNISELPVAILKKDYYSLNSPFKKFWWAVEYVFHKGIFNNVSLRFERNDYLMTFVDGREMIPYAGMKIDYSGKAYGNHPQKYISKYNALKERNRKEVNAQSRSRYHNIKAIERFHNATNGKYLDVSKIPMDDVFKLWNVSHRRVLIDYYGMDNIIASLNSKIIDTDTIDGNYYELILVNIPDKGEITRYRNATYLRMINPSTGEIHFEGVPNYQKPTSTANRENSFFIGRDIIVSPTVNAALAWRNSDTNTYIKPQIIT